MLVLALETSERTGSIALVRDEALLEEALLEPGKGHGARLLAAVDALLRRQGVAIGDIDRFAASAGPGSFTGVRVGLGTARALAWSLGKPVVALPSLLVLAHNVRGALAAPVMDACKGEVYGALYDGEVELVAPSVAAPERWRETVLAAAASRPTVFFGSGTATFQDVFGPGGADPSAHAATLGRLAARAREPLPAAVARYVRPSEAELKHGLRNR